MQIFLKLLSSHFPIPSPYANLQWAFHRLTVGMQQPGFLHWKRRYILYIRKRHKYIQKSSLLKLVSYQGVSGQHRMKPLHILCHSLIYSSLPTDFIDITLHCQVTDLFFLFSECFSRVKVGKYITTCIRTEWNRRKSSAWLCNKVQECTFFSLGHEFKCLSN